MRAVTVPISATSGVAGFIFPGDRVDLVLTQDVAGGGDGQPLKASETIIRNLRVLAVDQTMDKTPKAGEERSEEHTSELQSLMRISYAVFCLKKKTNKKKSIES